LHRSALVGMRTRIAIEIFVVLYSYHI
jgi:hypothetical protein